VAVEALVVLRAPADTAHPPPLRWTIVGALPPRLLLVRLQAGDLAGVQADTTVAHVVCNGVQAVALRPTPPLDDNETLFVAAFAARGSKSGPRPGEALDWDSPGFTPPGTPRRR
jgi:hypothetical protein